MAGGMRGRGEYMSGGGMCGGGMHGRGGHAWRGACVARTPHPHVNRMADACKNITSPQTSFAGGRKHGQALLNTLKNKQFVIFLDLPIFVTYFLPNRKHEI